MTRYETVAQKLYDANQGDPHTLMHLLNELVITRNYPIDRIILIGERLFKVPAHRAYEFVAYALEHKHFC